MIDSEQTNPLHLYERQPLKEMPTDKDLQVLQLIANGLNNAQVARELFLQPSTVNFRVHKLLAKLNAKNRAQAVAITMRRGLIQ